MPRATSFRNGRLRRVAQGAGATVLAALVAVLAPGAASAAPDHGAAPDHSAATAQGTTAVVGVTAAASSAAAPATCQHSFVPAYPWSSTFWTRAINSKPAPAVMILNVTGTGAGTAPVSHFQTLVRKAQKAGIAVLGYSSTEYGQRPAAQVEADAKNYRAWYKINGMFLDLTANARNELSYYRGVAKYIRSVIPSSVIWLNVGAYPAQGYMSVGNVIVAFEGSYASYRQLQVPAWTAHYRPIRFADVIYATPASDLASAVSLSRQRRTADMYVTNLAGSPDPYTALPSYWGGEVAALAKGCSATAAKATTTAKAAAADVNLGQAIITSHRETVSG